MSHDSIFLGENDKCRTCEHLERDVAGNYCALSSRNLSDYSAKDKCKNWKLNISKIRLGE